ERSRAVHNLHQDLRIPGDYAPDVHQRMSLYKRVSQATTASELESLRAEVRDRYGPFPLPVEGLFSYAALRLRAEGLGIAQVDASTSSFSLRFSPETSFPPEALIAAVKSLPGARLNPEGLRIPRPPGAPVSAGLASLLSRLEEALGAEAAIIEGSTPRT
ncbi:MAG TPA: TRCF domain-containing protein, partial [Vicinamibacteria bacterium]